MRSSMQAKNSATIVALTLATTLLAGCAYVPHWFREDGPSTQMEWDSPSAADIKATRQPAAPRERGGQQITLAPSDGATQHWPLYFEDPFVDKGHGRTDETHPRNVYHAGAEDYVALPYGPARFIGNLALLPVSAIVTPPVTVQESDGRLSRQLLGYDHDAESMGYIWTPPSELSPIVEDRVNAADGKAPTADTQPAPAAK